MTAVRLTLFSGFNNLRAFHIDNSTKIFLYINYPLFYPFKVI